MATRQETSARLAGPAIRRILGATAALISLMLCSPARSAQIAVLATSDAPRARGLADLVEAELSSRTGISVVNRSRIQSVLREQEMAAAMPVKGEEFLTLGNLLMADVFVALRVPPELADQAMVSIVDGQNGARLWDAFLEAGPLDVQATRVLEAVELALAKRDAKTGPTHWVCVMSVRNAEFGREMTEFTGALEELLAMNLVRTPAMCLVERSYLEYLNAEQTLPGAPSVTRLRQATVTIDVDVVRAEQDDRIAANVVLSDQSGRTLHRFRVSAPRDAVALADEIQTGISDALGSPPDGDRIPGKREAVRFQYEARHDKSHGRFDRAFRNAMAAIALDPDDRNFRVEVGRLYLQRATLRVFDDTASAMEDAERALDIWLDEKHSGSVEVARLKSDIDAFLKHLKSPRLDPRLSPLSAGLRERYLRAWNLQPGATHTPPAWEIEVIALCSVTTEDYLASLTSLVDRWLAYHDRPDNPWRYALHRMRQVCGQGAEQLSGPARNLIPRNDLYYRSLRELAARMEAHGDPLINRQGELARLFIDRLDGQTGPEDIRTRVADLQARLKEYITGLPAPANKHERYRRTEAYWVMLDAADCLTDPEEKFAAFSDVFDFMLARKDLISFVCRAATSPVCGPEWHMTYPYLARIPRPDSTLPRRLRNARALAHAYGDSSFNYPDPFMKRGDKGWVLALIQTMENERPPETAEETSADGARLLLDASVPARFFKEVVPIRGAYYLFDIQSQEGPTGDGMVTLRKIRLDGQSERVSEAFMPRARWLRVTSTDEALYASGQGVWRFPLDGTSPHEIPLTTDLPVDNVHAFLPVGDDQFYVCGRVTEGTQMVRANPRSGKVAIIASSNRKTPESPLDNLSPPFVARAMKYDASRNRIVLVIDHGYDKNNPHDYLPSIGIWMYRIDTGKLVQLQRFNRSCRWVGQIADDHLLCAPWSYNPWQPGRRSRPWYGAVEFDLTHDHASVAYAYNDHPAGPDLRPDAYTIRADILLHPPYLLTRDRFYYVDAGILGYTALDEKTTHAIADLKWRPDSGPVLAQLIPVPGTNQIIAANEKKIWLITPPPTTGPLEPGITPR